MIKIATVGEGVRVPLKKSNRERSLTMKDERIVLCNEACPQFGKLKSGLYECYCACGKAFKACRACLDAERVKDCGCGAEAHIFRPDETGPAIQ